MYSLLKVKKDEYVIDELQEQLNNQLKEIIIDYKYTNDLKNLITKTKKDKTTLGKFIEMMNKNSC
jgi:hypothetical protein